MYSFTKIKQCLIHIHSLFFGFNKLKFIHYKMLYTNLTDVPHRNHNCSDLV